MDSKIKIAFGMIVFEGDYVLKECLEQVYPFATQILIAEGPVSYWQGLGKKTSGDDTNKILNNFSDPENKICVVHGQYSEKDDQCRSYMKNIRPDIDYIWNLDSDEIYKTDDLSKMVKFLYDERPSSVGVRSCSFYGGFDHYLTGFELKTDNFLRIFRYENGATWLTHRPPTIIYPSNNILKKHINSDSLYNNLGIQMYHYSYVFPDQVYNKIGYYKNSVSKNNCIDNYFRDIYLPWVLGDNNIKKEIEKKYIGVHEWKPNHRGECYTREFCSTHPESIYNNLSELKEKFKRQLSKYIGL